MHDLLLLHHELLGKLLVDSGVDGKLAHVVELATYQLSAIVRICILIIDGTLTGSIKLIMIFKTVNWTLCSLYPFLLLV